MRATQGLEYLGCELGFGVAMWGGISLKTSCRSPMTIRIIVYKTVEEDISLKRWNLRHRRICEYSLMKEMCSW